MITTFVLVMVRCFELPINFVLARTFLPTNESLPHHLMPPSPSILTVAIPRRSRCNLYPDTTLFIIITYLYLLFHPITPSCLSGHSSQRHDLRIYKLIKFQLKRETGLKINNFISGDFLLKVFDQII